MAVRLEGTIQRFIGTSQDNKPGVPADRTMTISAGSSFLEVDTGKIYRWDGFHWNAFVPLEEQTELLALIAQQLAVLQREFAVAFDLNFELIEPA